MNPEVSKEDDIIKSREKINYIETKKIEKINKTKIGFFDKIKRK